MALTAQGIADLSWVPSAAVAEVQLLKDGASAIYGTDAVAGVVNLILLEEPEDNETRARYATTTRTGRQEVSVSQTLGTTGEHGAIVGVASYVNDTALTVDERTRTADVARPENIYPSNKQLSVYVAGRYEPGDAWTLRGQFIQSRIEAEAAGFWPDGHLTLPILRDRLHGAFSADYEGEQGWKAAITAVGSREDTDFAFYVFPADALTWDRERSQVQRLTQSLWSLSAEGSGAINLFFIEDLAIAIGAEHREEAYTRQLRSPGVQSEGSGRLVDSLYAELQMPLIRQIHEDEVRDVLRLSFAGRYDLYSDVGGRRNPKLGMAWTPRVGIEGRFTWGQSLRTPTVGEESTSAGRGTDRHVGFYSFRRADGRGTEPVALLLGSTPLRPEASRHWTVGLGVGPEILKGWAVELTYFNISYRDRIVAAPVHPEVLRDPDLGNFIQTFATPAELQEALRQQVGGPVEYADRIGATYGGGEFGEHPQDVAVTYYDSRLTNAAVLRTHGVDVGVRYINGDLKTGQWQLGVDATLTRKLETVFAPEAAAVDFVGTAGYRRDGSSRARWRLRVRKAGAAHWSYE